MKYFTIEELKHSDTAKNKRIDNTPPPKVVESLNNLVDNILDPLREAWGRPIHVNSGYRCSALNRAVRGASTSQHLKGEAADITTGSKEGNKKLFELIQTLDLPFDQLIDEKNYSWIHVSHRKENNRRQVLHLK
ncbi:D-Ala-D-Ala carboxypeptidase family metallohydrolase [Bacteroides sp. 51]|uniref:D-Ala-D-Ala carboxypeptidase family metallohydrolase n=1 Tax=Bacteroides sp. 51 TaxID=2302938 RepID=UPI0013D3D5E5|nr:D-Ala-D-Ala carboxypeptidase family metallohydrolase [Bacteroides sp. 51]NDV81318.1 peptidase M15 [Bacteroides sp. 51]